MKLQVFAHEWAKLDPAVRNILSKKFNIGRSGVTEVKDNVLICDGTTNGDLNALSMAKMIEFLGVKKLDWEGKELISYLLLETVKKITKESNESTAKQPEGGNSKPEAPERGSQPTESATPREVKTRSEKTEAKSSREVEPKQEKKVVPKSS